MKQLNYFGTLPALLTVLFIHHKLLGTLDWHWAWILSPLWIPVAVVLLVAGGQGFVRGYRGNRQAQLRARGRGGSKV